MRLYIEGHNHRLGYAVGVEHEAHEISATPACAAPESPVRFYSNLRYARRVVERFNRMAAKRTTAVVVHNRLA